MNHTVNFPPNAFYALTTTYANTPQGAFAELVQNAMQAHASKCTINSTTITVNNTKSKLLYVLDDGHGMSLEQVKQMTSFGQVNVQADEFLMGYKGYGFKAAIFALCKDALIVTRNNANCTTITSYSMSHNANDIYFKAPSVTLLCNKWQDDTATFGLIEKHFGLNKDGLLSLCCKITGTTGTMIVMHNLKSTIQLDCCNSDIAFPKASSDDVLAASSLRSYCEMMYLSRSMKIELFGTEIIPFDYNKFTHKAQTILVNNVQFHFATNKACASLGWSGFNLYTPDGKSVYCFEKCIYDMRPGVIAHATINMPVKINKLQFEDANQVRMMMHAAYEEYIALYPTSKYKVKKTATLPAANVKQCAVSAKRPRSNSNEEEEEEEIVAFNTAKKTRLF